MFFDPFSDLREMLVLLPNVIFLAEVDEIDNGFSGKEEERVDNFDLVKHSN